MVIGRSVEPAKRIHHKFHFKMNAFWIGFLLTGTLLAQTATVEGQWWTAFYRQKSTCKIPGYFVNPFDCTKFFRCVDHSTDARRLLVRYDFDCPEGTAFDENVNVCNYPGASGCVAEGGFVGYPDSSGGNEVESGGGGDKGGSNSNNSGGSSGNQPDPGKGSGGGKAYPAYPFFWPPPPRPANPRYYPPFYSFPNGYDNHGNYVIIYTNSKKK